MKLSGTYIDDDSQLEYVCRVIPYKGKYFTPINQELHIQHGDMLYMLGKGTWFALYQTSDRRAETLKTIGGDSDQSLPDVLKPKENTPTFPWLVAYEVEGANYEGKEMKIDYSRIKF